MSEARVRVSLTDGVLEFEGPEQFVAGLVEKFTGVIQAALGASPPDANATAAGESGAGDASLAENAPPVSNASPAPEVALTDLFAATETGVQILRPLPGSTRAERTVNLAKLYLYGLRTLTQRDTVPFAEIGRACRAHGCFDSHNMATYLKGDRTSFVFGGKGKRQTLKLSVPGMEGTAALIARLRAGANGIASGPNGIARHAMQHGRQDRESTPSHQPTLAASRR